MPRAEHHRGHEPRLTGRQLGQILGCGRWSIDSWVRAGVPHLVLGGTARRRRRFLLSQVEAWLQERGSRRGPGRPHRSAGGAA
jgi:hypothetical protein